jgi:molybdopterin-binding protein
MLDGRIRQVAGPEELFRMPSDPEVADFLGLCNVLPVTKVEDDKCRTCDVEIHVSSADDSVSYIWIKPEEILLSKESFSSSARNQFRCKVVDWEHRDNLLAINISIGDLRLYALITYTSYKDLAIQAGTELYATFKSSAVHCF